MKWFEIWKENEQTDVFGVFTEFFNQPKSLESCAKFLFGWPAESRLTQKGHRVPLSTFLFTEQEVNTL
jgi:hypothetical protein